MYSVSRLHFNVAMIELLHTLFTIDFRYIYIYMHIRQTFRATLCKFSRIRTLSTNQTHTHNTLVHTRRAMTFHSSNSLLSFARVAFIHIHSGIRNLLGNKQTYKHSYNNRAKSNPKCTQGACSNILNFITQH